MKNILNNFKAMPWLLKLLFIFSVWTLFVSIKDFVQLKPITFSYFNSDFPRNYPVVWYIYLLLVDFFTIFTYLKRSFRWLIAYLLITFILAIPGILNQRLIIAGLLSEQRLLPNIVFVGTLSFCILIMIYIFKQKKYFNKP